VLVAEFLERKRWRIQRICPVNYDVKDKWLATALEIPAAVVDFLYHPQAAVWADHHTTSFLSPAARADFEQRRNKAQLWYEGKSPSCSSLLWEHVGSHLGSVGRYQEMVYWANKIDSADYSSVKEAIFGDAPALRINSSLMCGATDEYCIFLVANLRRRSLAQVAELSAVQQRYDHVRSKIAKGLEYLKDHIRLEPDGIVVFEAQTAEDSILSRYAPYHFFPQARYSIGLVHSPKGASITAMRNPWHDFTSIPLGRVFERHGGGGHQRVGSVFIAIEHVNEARPLLEALLHELRTEQSSATAREGALV
jgi:hypothetical protein